MGVRWDDGSDSSCTGSAKVSPSAVAHREDYRRTAGIHDFPEVGMALLHAAHPRRSSDSPSGARVRVALNVLLLAGMLVDLVGQLLGVVPAGSAPLVGIYVALLAFGAVVLGVSAPRSRPDVGRSRR